MAYDVFISYSSGDAEVANLICTALENSGHGCWIAPRDIEAGVNYPTAIIKGIRESKVLVVVLSEDSLTSDHVASEIHFAFSNKVPIIAFRIEDIDLSEEMEYLLGSRNRINATSGPLEEHLDKLIDGVRKLVSDSDSDDLPERKPVAIFDRPAARKSTSWIIYLLGLIVFTLTLALLRDEFNTLTNGNIWLSALITAIPLIFVLPEAISHAQRNLTERRLRIEGKHGTLRDPEYFRTYPYDSIPDYMDVFRADMAHEKVLAWINRSNEPILFLTGRSGTGKSSILNAYVRPELENQDPPAKTLLIRSFDDPLNQVRNEISKLGIEAEIFQDEDMDIRTLIMKAIRETETNRLVLIFDQFEELLVIHEREPERIKRVKDMLLSLRDNPIPGLTVLLTLRSDYLPLLEDFELPPLRHRENWYEIGAFSETHARRFLERSNIRIPEETMDSLFDQISDFEGTRGLVRPIILNMVGLIVSKMGDQSKAAKGTRTDNLIEEYIKHNLFRRDMRDHAPRILSHMVTTSGTKQPMSVSELADLSKVPEVEVRGTMNLLGNEGIVRCIDRKAGIWEISHDFIAHHLLVVLRSTRQPVMELILRSLAPIALALWLILIFFFFPGYIADFKEQRIIQTLTDLGATIEVGPEGIVEVEYMWNEGLTFFEREEDPGNVQAILEAISDSISLESLTIFYTTLNKASLELLGNLVSLENLYIGFSGLTDEDLEFLKHLSCLKYLDLRWNNIHGDGLVNLNNLTALEDLVLFNNPFGNDGLAYISSLETLISLDLSECQITSEGLEYLKNMTMVEKLNLGYNTIDSTGLPNLSGLTSLTELRLGDNEIDSQGLIHLSTLTSLEFLDLSCNEINDGNLEPLVALESLKKLDFYGNSIGNEGLSRLSNLISLEVLYLGETSISDSGLAYLNRLTSLDTLDIGGNSINDEGLITLRELPLLKALGVYDTNISDEGLEILAGFPSLEEVDISGTQVSQEAILRLLDQRPDLWVNY